MPLAESIAADVQKVMDSSGKEISQQATFSVPFEQVRKYVESAPAPRRPNRNKPIHFTEEFQAWEAASDEALENFDKEFPPGA